jgi:archaellin
MIRWLVAAVAAVVMVAAGYVAERFQEDYDEEMSE